jgi:FlaG/FlaF family flagellin (archaellin)
MITKKSDDAVSPVIGVMLMLVVTVVIAAVITAFATGMAGDSTTTTPMALIEADTPQVSGVLQSFDLVHKGGDEMKLENLQVIIEPIGESGNTGITLKRTGTSEGGELNPDYEDERQGLVGLYEDLKGMGENVRLIESGGKSLSVPGKTGEDIVVSTGDRIRVPVKASAEGLTLEGNNGERWVLINSANKYYSSTDEGDNNNIGPGILVKWTLSDVRTTGVIAKGEFVVPEP